MIQPRSASLLTHLTLAASGLCLAVASMPLLPEMPFLVIGYLLLVGASWRWASRWMMPTWVANVLALVIAGSAVGYVMLRVHSSVAFEWIRDLPVQVALLPLLGPVLLALAVVRLLRSRSSRDILQLHGMALLQVALGCILASPTLFGFFLLVYFVLALGALAANEAWTQYREARPPDDLVAPAGSLKRELRFGLRWLVVVVLPAFSLFLMLPRIDGRQWEPLARLGNRQPRAQIARTGWSDEIDLRRTGTLVNDDMAAFVVRATSPTTAVPEKMPADQHWRGHVLDRYERGVWKAELSGFTGVPQIAAPRADPSLIPSVLLEFRVQGQVGSLFLADPVIPGAVPGQLPVFTDVGSRGMPLFFEGGGTALPMTYLPRSEYRYSQQFFSRQSRARYPCVRVGDLYQYRLLRCEVKEMLDFTLKLLLRISDEEALKTHLRAIQADLSKPKHQRRVVTLPPGQWSHVCRLLSDHLAHSDEFSYDMTSRRADPTIDPTLDFLRNVRQGSCERYASSLTLMLRSVGIPARIIKGFRGWEPEGADNYRVLNRHAHAWVEAMVAADTTGPLEMEWLILDPTPSHEEPATSALVSWLQQQQRSGQTLWQDLILNYGPNSRSALLRELFTMRWSRVVSWLFFATVLCAGYVWIRRRRRARRPRPNSLGPALLFTRLRAVLLARLKLATHPGQTPAELAELARSPLAERPQTEPWAGLPARVVALYYRERFGRNAAEPAEVAALAAEIEHLKVALGN